MKQVRFICAVLLMFQVFPGIPAILMGQQPTATNFQQQLERYRAAIHPQKLFVHFDKEAYAAGETIWLKGYLVEAADHALLRDSANVYLELWDTRGEKITELIFRPREGAFYGQIPIGSDFADGNYAIRAFTDRMLNRDESYWFHKNIYISNSSFANRLDNETRKFNRDFNESIQGFRDATRVDFFAEGGSLVEGLESRLVVRVADGLGKGKSVKGQISEQNGGVVTEFETGLDGLGLVVFRPEPGKSYVAGVTGARRGLSVVPLPPVKKEGFVLKADILEDELEVQISGNMEMTGHSLLVQSGGEILFIKDGLPNEKNRTFRFSLEYFPTGISQVVLFSPGGVPLAERLVFVNHDDQIYLDMNARVLRSEGDAVLRIEVLASDQEGQAVQGNFSVAVQYGQVGERTSYDNIFSNLLLGSDVERFLDLPGQYFDYSRDNPEALLDLLLMTQTWGRFSWSEVMDSMIPDGPFLPEYGVDVGGALVAPQGQVGIGNAEVRLRVVEEPSQAYQTKTDAEGRFLFRGLQLFDTTMVEVIPPMIAGRQVPEVELDQTGRLDQGIPPLVFTPKANTPLQQITERGKDWRRPRTGRSGTPPERGGQLYGTPDQTIYIDSNEPYTNILDVLRDKAIGLSISPSGFITIRGITSINYQNPPLFIVDGVESEGAFSSLHPRDVERIEIFRGASTAAFGARGAAGALVAYSKRRDFQAELLLSSMFLVNGFHVAESFRPETEPLSGFDSMNKVKTAFWEPLLKSGEDGTATLQFRPIPGLSQYRIVIQGVGENGKVGYAEFILGN